MQRFLEKVGVKDMISDVIDELLRLAEANGCKFVPNFKQLTMDDMLKPNQAESIMWQDYVARRPMEVETYLGSPIKLARDAGVSVPRIETLYAILHNLNIVNRNRPKDAAPGSPNNASPLPPRGTISSRLPAYDAQWQRNATSSATTQGIFQFQQCGRNA